VPLDVSVVTPEREVWTGEANFVVARSEGGELGVLPGHAPFLGSLRHSVLKIESAEGTTFIAAHGGFIEVFEDRVTVLTPVAEVAGDIDVDRARREREEAAEDREAFLRADARLRTAAAAGVALYD
jgi:F-type H+-transporting ATPase subunit epsilon